ncbi:DUF3313 domain-containing protein [Pseudoalteromonas peptidolytica]|uniref:DUF3313 domain-containing protein n=1 Tax=Pseudoalteromonas peptidolytica TaxID=61150 RepID=UPI00298E3D85|nr:DUF3313 domain-containing protein [Pseudoalteromonas peptidolytica]MDW7550403.1 DUF3313 domain-containing protein [Pseudoalteromonas peptidolytica]
MQREVHNADVLANLSGLKQDKSHEPVLVYIRPGAPKLDNYRKFIIDPVKVNYGDEGIKEFSAEELTYLQNYFHNAMRSALEDAGYEVVTKNGKGVLRVSFTLTDLKAPQSVTNLSILLVPGLSTSVGAVTIEAEFRDAHSNSLNAVVVESSQGSYLFNQKPWSSMGDIESAFDHWAEGFSESVKKAHSGS